MNFEKMLKFNNISRAGTVGIFLWKNLTSLNGISHATKPFSMKKFDFSEYKFHMHVSDDDSNMFCKFDESWWTLKKCWIFHDISRAGTVGIFLWNK